MTQQTDTAPQVSVQAIIFDLDDTLVETCKYYDMKRQLAFSTMAEAGLDITRAQTVLDETEFAQVKRYGFAKERFPLSLGMVYEHLCREQSAKVDPWTKHKVEGVGWSVYQVEHPLIEDAEKVLGALRYAGYQLICMTKGDDQIQTAKLDQTGLGRYFHQVVVVPDKTIKQYEGMAKIYNLTPEDCFMVGDSVKSDINPARAAGFHAIHIPPPATWAYEREEAQFNHLKVDKLDDLLGFFRARWAVDKNHEYQRAPNKELLRGARDGKFRMIRDHETQEMMPDCPGVIFRFLEDGEDGDLGEYRGVFPCRPEDEGKPGHVRLPDGDQIACAGYFWPGYVNKDANHAIAKNIKETVAENLCTYCQNMPECFRNGVVNGVKRSPTS
jgi:putative hydrolase of the HAD superfamily